MSPAEWRPAWRSEWTPQSLSDHGADGHRLGAAPSPEMPGDGQVDGLPRRVRQASLRPELQDSPPPPERSARGYAARTPENARATLAALRSGWLRGQSDRSEDSSQGRQG